MKTLNRRRFISVGVLFICCHQLGLLIFPLCQWSKWTRGFCPSTQRFCPNTRRLSYKNSLPLYALMLSAASAPIETKTSLRWEGSKPNNSSYWSINPRYGSTSLSLCGVWSQGILFQHFLPWYTYRPIHPNTRRPIHMHIHPLIHILVYICTYITLMQTSIIHTFI